MSSLVECPVCGKKVDSNELELLDNGNPACRECVAKEKKEKEEE